ncbi:hypothetical protein BJ741DRAFT_588384 [Chytriomyces cf. hyalinus JEL632]|nr:hypothetical protein BJ741DRAFT_588384 [Chytriomyces cf. hyalinus JEL632]
MTTASAELLEEEAGAAALVAAAVAAAVPAAAEVALAGAATVPVTALALAHSLVMRAVASATMLALSFKSAAQVVMTPVKAATWSGVQTQASCSGVAVAKEAAASCCSMLAFGSMVLRRPQPTEISLVATAAVAQAAEMVGALMFGLLVGWFGWFGERKGEDGLALNTNWARERCETHSLVRD